MAVTDSIVLTCDRCGYDLRGCAQPRCPECGESFDPLKKEKEARELRQRILHRATPWPTWRLALSLIVFGETFALRSNPGNPWYYSIGLGGVVILRLALFLAILLLWIDWLRRRRAGRQAVRAGWRTSAQLGRRRRWAVLPLLMLLWISTWWWNWMLLARFHLARPFLEAAAQSALKHGTLPVGQTIGTYHLFGGYTNSWREVDGQTSSIVSFYTGCRVEIIDQKKGYDEGSGFDYRSSDPWPSSPKRIAPCWYVVD